MSPRTVFSKIQSSLLTLAILAILPLEAGAAASSAQATVPDTSHAAPAQVAQPPGVYRLSIGDFRVTALSDGTVPQDLHALLTGTTPKDTDELLTRGFRQNPVEASINAFLIEANGHLLLVDTGAGEFFGPGYGGKLAQSLQAVGIAPAQITEVLITHVHTDHVGGLTRAGKIQFPHARVFVGKPDLDFFLDAANSARTGYAKKYFDEAATALGPYVGAGSVVGLSGQQEILPGVTAIPTPGHTPGHYFYRIASRGQELTFLGDIIHVASVQFPEPAITIVYDVDPKAAASMRKERFAAIARGRDLVAAAHLPFPGIGNIRVDGKAYAWVPVDYEWRERQ